MVSYFNGGTQAERVSDQSSKENIWTFYKVIRGWRKLHDEEFCSFLTSTSITGDMIKECELDGACVWVFFFVGYEVDNLLAG